MTSPAAPMPGELVVLAGGAGTRLRPVVKDVPKPLAPVAGRPFLHWLLDGMARQGVSRFVLSTGHMGDMIRAAIGDRYAGRPVAYVHEEEPLGTGGAVWAALARCEGRRAFVVNGDTWTGTPLAPLAAQDDAADIVLAVKPVADRARYGSVRVEEGRVVGVEEKGPCGPGLINTGLYLLRTDLPVRHPMPEVFNFEREVLARPEIFRIAAMRTEAAFIDIGTPDDFGAAQHVIPAWAGTAG